MFTRTFSFNSIALTVLGVLVGVAAMFSAASLAHAQATTTGRIIVDKVTVPGGATTTFSFNAQGGSYADFTLTDASQPNAQTLATGTYRIAELKTKGWRLASSTCSVNGATSTVYVPGSALALNAGDTIACTFTNVQATSTPKKDNGKHNGWMKGWPWGIFKKIFNDDFPGFDQPFFKNFFGHLESDDAWKDRFEAKAEVKAEAKAKFKETKEKHREREREKRDARD